VVVAVDVFLGRVLSADRVPVGTCFQVAPGVVVTAWQVLAEVGSAGVGSAVLIDALASRGSGGVVSGRVVRVDAVHDLAVVVLAEGVLSGVVAGFAPTGEQALSTPVTVAGVAAVSGFVEASGRLEGSGTRDGVVVGRVESKAITAGMRGAPVLRRPDGLVVGVVSGRYNPADDGLRDSVWVVRVEDLLLVLDGVADPLVHRSTVSAAVDVSVVVDADQVTVSGQGRQAVTVPHRGVVPGLRVSLDVFRRSRSGLTAHRDLTVEGSAGGRVEAPVLAVGRALTENFLADGAGRLFEDLVAAARAGHRATRVGLRVVPELAGLPWETMLSPGSGLPLGVDPQVRAFRQARSAAAVLPGPLRIVVAISSPLTGGGQVLDYERELRNVLSAVRAARAYDADVRVVHFATTTAIRAALTAAPAHVLHLSGHGLPGLLVLEDEDGAARPVTADVFLDEAVPFGATPPVFALAACHTASNTTTAGGSFAEGLLARGAGVVIATETSISDVYATRVFARVYGRLAADPAADVVAAVAEARAAVQVELERSVDDRDRRLAGFQEWSTVSVYAPSGSVPIIDPDAPFTPVHAGRGGAGILRREVGEVVGRRREQREWPAALLSGRTAGIVIHGLGGVGKTTLADELVTRILEREPDRLVVAVTGPVTGEQLFTELARQVTDQLHDRATPPPQRVLRLLSRIADPARSPAERTATLHDLLAEVPVLVVLDNFEDNLAGPGVQPVLPALAGLLAALVARPGRGRLLVTCRYRFTLPGNAHRGLTFHHLGPLSFAETMKLAWALPHLDRMTSSDLERVWRAVGGHPRCLEYVDALLAGGTARYTDVTVRLATAVEHHLRAAASEVRDPDVDTYLGAHTTLDHAVAEVATLAADDILLDQLLTALAPVPEAVRLLTGASVYRVPVDRTALAYQLGDLDPTIDPTGHIPAIDQQITDLLTANGVPPDAVTLDGLAPAVRRQVEVLVRQRLPVPQVTVDPHLDQAAAACVDSGLLTPDRRPDGSLSFFVHRWTATALADHTRQTGLPDRLIDAHVRAARYWRWCVRYWPQDRHQDAADLLEAQHHLRRAADLGHQPSHTDLADTTRSLAVTLHALGRRHDAAVHADALHRLRQHQHTTTRTETSLADLADAATIHGVTLSAIGQHQPAHTATLEAVDVYRRLAAANPAAFEPNLATSLNNIGNMLSELGRREEALAATLEAVEVRRRLAAANPAAFEPNLATSLNNLGNVLSELGRREEALAATLEAVEVNRRLAAANPAAFEPDLAMSLNNLGLMLSGLGRREEALAATLEAVEVYERLAAANPAAFESDLAGSLNNLGLMLSELGRREEALAATLEAVEVNRRLAAANPAAFEPNLATSLNNLGADLSGLGRREEALTATLEAVEVNRRLAAANPAAFEPDLAGSLNNLGAMLSGLGRREEALTATLEAVEVRRRLAAANPAAFEPDLASSLNNLGIRLSGLGRPEEALAAVAEAVDLYRKLASHHREAHLPDLANALWNVGYVALTLNAPTNHAIAMTAEGVQYLTELAAQRPAAFTDKRDAAAATLAQLQDANTTQT
jgi:tetratricopeptide (TPR) repeat protein